MPLPQILRLPLAVLLLASLTCGLASAAPVHKVHPAPRKSLPQTLTTTIPFDYDPILMPYIVVQSSINGKPPLPFIVDTGATGYYLSVEPWAAKKLGLRSSQPSKSRFVKGQGQKEIIYTLVDTIRTIGLGEDNDLINIFNSVTSGAKKSSQGNTPFQIVSILSPIANVCRGPQPAGIITLDTLRLPGMLLQIDFQHKLLVFIQKKKDWQPAAGATTVPLHQNASSGLYNLTATLASGQTLDFALDTGSPWSAVHNMADLPLVNEQSTQDLFALTDGERFYDKSLLPELHLGGLVEPSVAMWETPENALSSSENLLGLDFLSRFLVTLDFANSKMYLKRRMDYARQVVPLGQANVRLEKRGVRYTAAWVEAGSPAELVGLHSGDEIVNVDDQPLGGVPLQAAQNLLDGWQGTTAKLKVQTAGGKEILVSFTRSPKFLGRRHALLGVSVEWVQGYLMVSSVTPGSPLDGALRYDDMVYSINEQLVSKMTMDEALRLLERPDLALQVWRSSDKSWREVHVTPLPAQTQVLVGPPPAGTQYRYYDKAGWTVVPL